MEKPKDDQQDQDDQKEQQNAKATEQPKKEEKPLEDKDLELFTEYMQCFKNRTAQNIKYDQKFNELVKKRKFWDTQPVPKPSELKEQAHGPLEVKKVEDIPATPIKLPENFVWQDVDLEDEKDIEEIYTLLYENYVEDDDGYFRFNYSKEFLRWALLPPKRQKDLHFGIRDHSKGGILIGFISGIILELKVEGATVNCTEVNFLCVKKEYRNHYIASVLIREVVRRSNRKNIWQGLYTSGTMLPTPIAQARYYHRNLNPKKLIDVKFSALPPTHKLSTHIKLYSLPEKPTLKEGYSLRKAEEKDAKQIRALLMDHLKQYSLYTEYSKKDCAHWFTHRDDIIECYVIEKSGKITDMFSFYSLPSSVLNHPKYNTLRAAYSYYFVHTSMSLKELYTIALIQASANGYDVFNALDIMDNEQVFQDLLFSGGDGYLNYYLYNWKLKKGVLHPHELGIVLM